MTGRTSDHARRSLVAACLGLAAIVAGARPASAGCHVADRPAELRALFASLNESPEVFAFRAVAPTPEAPTLAPLPCRDESSAPSSSPSPIATDASTFAGPATIGPATGARLHPDDATIVPLNASIRLDRPPRAGLVG